MRTYRTIAWFIGLAIFSGSCAQIIGIEDGTLLPGGPVVECKVFEDCLKDATQCRVPVDCTDGLCQYNLTTRGVQLATQVPGDCKNIICDGDGSTESVFDDKDIEDDKNACTTDSCNGDKPAHTPRQAGIVECYGGPVGTKGVGNCHGGTQECDGQGQPTTPCDPQVLPQDEACDFPPTDEDCDGLENESGHPDEGGTCSCGDGVISPGINETCEDGNLTPGDGCSPACLNVDAAQVASGVSSTCVLFTNGTVKCWGPNGSGQLGIGSTKQIGSAAKQMGAYLATTPLPAGKKALQLGGRLNFCALLDDQTLRCWGSNQYGQLGEGNTINRGDGAGEMGDQLPAIDLGSNAIPMSFDIGRFHVCAVLTGGALKCWGTNSQGQLGLGVGDILNRGDNPGEMGDNLNPVNVGSGLTVKKVAAGHAHTCVILSNDRVKCWGTNGSGQLGLGNANNLMAPISTFVDLDADPKTMVKALASGRNHNCVILGDNSVKCWGKNDFGQLGLGNIDDRGDGPNEMGGMLPRVNLGDNRTAKAIAAFGDHSCVLLDDDSLKCWGKNDFGELGAGDKNNRGISSSTMGNQLLPIDLGTGRHALSVMGGDSFMCALLDDKSVKCWGYGTEGNLGLGDKLNRGDEPMEMGDKLPFVKLFSDTW